MTEADLTGHLAGQRAGPDPRADCRDDPAARRRQHTVLALQRGTPENAALALEQFTAVAVALAAAGVPDDGTAYQNNTSA